jgi:hypothetical protein
MQDLTSKAGSAGKADPQNLVFGATRLALAFYLKRGLMLNPFRPVQLYFL